MTDIDGLIERLDKLAAVSIDRASIPTEWLTDAITALRKLNEPWVPIEHGTAEYQNTVAEILGNEGLGGNAFYEVVDSVASAIEKSPYRLCRPSTLTPKG